MKALPAAAFLAATLFASAVGAFPDAPNKKAPPKKPAPVNPLTDLAATFALLDANKDGELGYGEFSKLADQLPKASKAVPAADLSAVFDVLDEDKSVSVSAAEFKKLDAKVLAAATAKKPK